MNREQKHKAIKSLTAKGYSAEQAEGMLMMNAAVDSKKFLKEGDRVKLNVTQMQSRPECKSDIDQNKVRFQAWVLDHRDKVITVKYDKNLTINPSIVCVKEDKTDPKWIFWEGDLDVVERVTEE